VNNPPIATAMRQVARAASLRGDRLAAVLDATDYLQEYAPYSYGDAIEHALPIATGVIEGACQYLVKDRMDCGCTRCQAPCLACCASTLELCVGIMTSASLSATSTGCSASSGTPLPSAFCP
jgi:hypothetical protein